MKYIFLVLLSLCANYATAALDIESLLKKPTIKALDEDAAGFTMTGELGALLSSGNTDSSSFTGRIDIRHDMKMWNNKYDLEVLFKEDSRDIDGRKQDVTSAQKLYMSGQMEYKLTMPEDRLFLFAQYEEDRFKGFEYQAAIAAGWSSQLLKSKDTEWKYSVGPGYAIAESNNNSNASEQGLIVRLAMDYVHSFTTGANFTQTFSSEVNSNYIKSRAESALSSKLNERLAMKLSFLLDHNTDVQGEVTPLDTRTSVTLVYQFF